MVTCGSYLIQNLQLNFNNTAFEHYRCAAHVINLAVSRSIEASSINKSFFKSYFEKVKVCYRQNQPPKTPLDELNNYLELPPEENTDPLMW
ncbi:14073_t:CDS:2 [Racocetra persica]|uniref:14073_t:CDS:1 n=1 Tax=Racocetra persica TaxID=160502 RepID=A0ACA9PHV0_9GLOM|nr:14073_t:CDS:2 [Racocetra persica]